MQHLYNLPELRLKDFKLESITPKIDGVSAVVGKDEDGLYARRGDVKLYDNNTSKPSYNPLNFAREALRPFQGRLNEGTEIQLEVISEPRPDVIKYDLMQIIPLKVLSGAFDMSRLYGESAFEVPKIMSEDGVNYKKINQEYSVLIEPLQRSDMRVVDIRDERHVREIMKNTLLPTYTGEDLEGIVINGKYKIVNEWFNEARNWIWSFREGLFKLPVTEAFSYSWRGEFMIDFYDKLGDSRLGTLQARHVDTRRIRIPRDMGRIDAVFNYHGARLKGMLNNYLNSYERRTLKLRDKTIYVDEYTHQRNLSAYAQAHQILNNFKEALNKRDIEKLISLRRL